jgi:DNA-binding transcriptional regulator PaaX
VIANFSMTSPSPEIPSWTFLTNHGHVMVCIAQQPDIRLSEIGQKVGIGERAVHRIVHELIEAGYLTSTKVGRRNVYQLDLERPLRHPLESSHRLGAILDPLSAPGTSHV